MKRCSGLQSFKLAFEMPIRHDYCSIQVDGAKGIGQTNEIIKGNVELNHHCTGSVSDRFNLVKTSGME